MTFATLTLCLLAVQDPAEYFPLKAGMRWTYWTAGEKEYSRTVQDLSSTGEKGAWSISSFGQWGALSRAVVVPGAEGLVIRKLSKFDVNIPWLKNPMKAGEKWSARADLGGVQADFDFTVIGEQTVEVPAGKYECLKVKTEFKDSEGTLGETIAWYAKGVGEVKTESTWERNGRKTSLERQLVKVVTEAGK